MTAPLNTCDEDSVVSEPSEDVVPYSNHLVMLRPSELSVPFKVAAPAAVTLDAAFVAAVGVLASNAVSKPLNDVMAGLSLSQSLNPVEGERLALRAASSFAPMSSSSVIALARA